MRNKLQVAAFICCIGVWLLELAGLQIGSFSVDLGPVTAQDVTVQSPGMMSLILFITAAVIYLAHVVLNWRLLARLYSNKLKENAYLRSTANERIHTETGHTTHSAPGGLRGFWKPEMDTGKWTRLGGGLTNVILIPISFLRAIWIRLGTLCGALFLGEGFKTFGLLGLLLLATTIMLGVEHTELLGHVISLGQEGRN